MTAQNNSGKQPSSVLGRLVVVGLSVILLALVVFYLMGAEDVVDVEQDTSEQVLAPVTVLAVMATDQPIKIEAFASVQPRWSADIASAVSGRVTEVSDSALAGKRVKQGTILARIEPYRYEAEVASAQLTVKQAELGLWQAQNAKLLAVKQFERDGRKPPNELALKEPQLTIAKANLEQARARLKAAEQQLFETTISAPFSGFVTKRSISPGQSINAGDKLIRLVDDRIFELVVQLGAKDWRLLDHPLKGKQADIVNDEGEHLAKATIRDAAGFLDGKTRLHQIFLKIDATQNSQLLSGDFVKVSLDGAIISNALSLPESARTREGYVWIVDDEARLQRLTPKLLYRSKDHIIVTDPKITAGTSLRVVTIPLASFLPGQVVKPVEAAMDVSEKAEAN